MSYYNIKKVELKQIKSFNIFKNLKSDYFIRIIFDNLEKRKTLEIIKYNKNIKNRIKIDTINYKEYSETYSSIKIEIKLAKNKYGKFININDDNNRIYYHIYFNNSKEEIKKTYLEKNEQIKTIKIKIEHQVQSFKNLFYFCDCIESIYFKKFYRNNIVIMNDMFYGCSSLKDLNLNNFNTNNVKDMSGMFYKCISLKELNFSKFNTNNVTDMSYMFSGCLSIEKLNLNNFNTNKVSDMSYMFSGCSSLKTLNLFKFNTNNVTDMSCMFYKCLCLKELNISNFNTKNVKNMFSMFVGCSKLKELNLSNFNINNLTYITNMFSGCSDDLKNKIKVLYKNIKEEAFLDLNLI